MSATIAMEFTFPDVAAAENASHILKSIAERTAAATGATAFVGEVIIADLNTSGTSPKSETKKAFTEACGSEINLSDPALQAELDMPFTTTLIDSEPDMSSPQAQIDSALKREGITSFRDVLIVGLGTIRRICGTEQAVNSVRSAFAKSIPKVPMVESMRASDIALFCDSLEQIPFAALPGYYSMRDVDKQLRVGDLVDRNTFLEYFGLIKHGKLPVGSMESALWHRVLRFVTEFNDGIAKRS